MKNTLKALLAVALSAACVRSVNYYATCSEVNVPCACSPTLHGIEGCDHGQTTGQCLCVPAVTPTISIVGAPPALSAGQSYVANVNAVAGLTYSWSLSGLSATTSNVGPSISFTAGPPGLAQISVDTTNSGGDSATPQQLLLSIVQPPTALSVTDVLIPSTLTEGRQLVPLRVINPNAALTYRWMVQGAATLDSPTGDRVQLNLTDGQTDPLTVQVFAQNGGGAESTPVTETIQIVARQTEKVAGVLGGAGNIDGSLAAARLGPGGWLAGPDASGNLYLSDIGNSTVRRIDPSGNVVTIAGNSNSADVPGAGAAASFIAPPLVLTPLGLLIAQGVDTVVGNYVNCPLELLSGITTSAATSTRISPTLGHCIDTGADLSLSITAVAADANGYAYVLTPGATPVVVLVKVDGSASAVVLSKISGLQQSAVAIVVNSAGSKMYILDNIGIKVSTNSAPPAAASWTTPTEIDSPCTSASDSKAIAVDASDKVYLACSGNIWVSSPSPTTTANFSLLAGAADESEPSPPTDSPATFSGISSMALGGQTLYVSDNSTVRMVSLPNGAVTTWIGTFANSGVNDDVSGGPAAEFASLSTLVVNSDESIEVLDADSTDDDNFLDSGLCKIRTVSSSGLVKTLTGSACGLAVNGSLKNAAFAAPISMAGTPDGALYVTENCDDALACNDQVQQIREVTPQSLVITAAGVAPTPTPGAEFEDGFASTAVFIAPGAIAAGDGIVAAGDAVGADAGATVRVLIDGQIVTVAGAITGCTPGVDTLADAQCFDTVSALAIDNNGVIYASANSNLGDGATNVIFSMSAPDYVPVLVAGGQPNDCTKPVDGEPCASACLRNPASALAVSPATGLVYFADGEIVRRVDPQHDGSCLIHDIAGVVDQVGVALGPQGSERLSDIVSLAFSPTTLDLYAADFNESVVLRVRY